MFISGLDRCLLLYSTHAHFTSTFPRPAINVADANWYVLVLSMTYVDPHKNRNGNRIVLIMTISSFKLTLPTQ